MMVLNPIETATPFKGGSFRASAIPDIAFCEEKARLTGEFLRAIHQLTELHSQLTRAIIDHDPEFSRFDVLIHMAAERKEDAKYALMVHMESHHCEEG